MNNFDFFLKVFLFLAPIFYWQNWPLAKAQLQFFQHGIVFLFLVALSQKKQRDLRDRTLTLLGIVCFLNVFLSPTPFSNMALVNIVFALLLYYLIVCYTKNVRCIFWILIALSIINTILAVFQKFGIDFVYSESSECCAFLGTSAFHGDFQAIVVPMAMYIHPLLAIFPIAGLVLSKSATAILACSLGISFLVIKKRFKFVYFTALFSGIVFYLIYFRDLLLYKIILRFTVWQKVLELIFERPYRGWGFGSVRGLAGEFFWPQYGTADRLYSEPLEFALCVGIIGVIPLVIFLCNKVKRYMQAQKSLLLNTVFASCLIAGIVSLSHSPMAALFSQVGESPRVAVVIIAVFAMLEILLKGAEVNENKIYRR